jgi:adenylate cyclase
MQGRHDEGIAENERALALDPSDADAVVGLGFDYWGLGQFEKGLEYIDKAIRLSPHDPALFIWYGGKAFGYFALKQYDQAIEWAHRSIAINPNYNSTAHGNLIAALALTGRDAEASEALQRSLALPPPGAKTIAAWKAYRAQYTNPQSDPRYLEMWDRMIEGLRKAGMPET